MPNKLSKNAEKGGTGLALVAAATMISNAATTNGFIPADMEQHATIIVSGVLFAILNFLKHSVRRIKEKRQAAGR